MNITNLLIHLHHNVDAFSFKQRHLDQLRVALPDTRITVASDNRDFMARLPDADAVIAWLFKAEWYDEARKLKVVFTPAAGRDWVDGDPSGRVATRHGSFHGRIMRESLLSMMLYFNRRVGMSLDDQRNRHWGRLDYSSCVALFSQQVLLVGYGSLGRSMAELLRAFGAGVTGVRRSMIGSGADPVVERVVPFDRLEEELPHADHVVLLLPGDATTDGIFTARHFSAMKPGACLYNLGRGNCYREEDLLHALQQGPLAGAGLDVFAEEPLPPESPLWSQPNVLITPHSSAISREYVDLSIEEMIAALREM
ncbi:MAG: D-2-hydroxyacid dehydrogenase [Geobacter sp.]|nr:D-2-hydroxyacid dehydrogenase [Geobacter sp.]